MSFAAHWVLPPGSAKMSFHLAGLKPAYSGLLPVKWFIISDSKSAIE